MIKKFGIENVRGDSYCNIDISKKYNEINDKINNACDKCFRCGRTSHFSNNYYAKTHNDGYLL